MKYLLSGLIGLALALPTPAAYAATNSGQSVSTLSTADSLLVAKKKKAAKKSKAKVAKK